MASNAVGVERKSRIVGYKITKGNFADSSPNLPQRVAIIGEGNTNNQSNFTSGVPVEVFSAKQAGEIFGYGSPIHMAMRILRPVSGDGIGGIPTVVYPQTEDDGIGCTSTKHTISVLGSATKNTTHYINIAGRTNVDGSYYAVNISKGNTASQVALKIHNAILSVLGSPVKSTVSGTTVTTESKWKGDTSNYINIYVDTDGDSAGLTYAVNSAQTGTGTPSIQNALDSFQNEWNTIVLNTYGTNEIICNDLEAFNGVPDPENPTGRYSGIVMKPFIALTGTTSDDSSEFADPRKDEVTIAICPAPLSTGLSLEIASAYCLLFARNCQDTPHLDIAGRYLTDVPVKIPVQVITNEYNERDRQLKLGTSTASLIGDRYLIQDFVTTYHPDGEVPAQFAYCRNLMVDFNIRYGYYLLELANVSDHVIVNDDDVVTASKFIKPKQWKAILGNYADDLSARALIADPGFMSDSVTVQISTTNPDRFETFFRCKRSGIVRIASTTAEMGFNFGSNQ